jgi:mRNA deadenylase 3'-5' endonuclease subunit Ccr4
MKKIITFITILLVVFVISFYFWAKTANLNQEDYVEVVQFRNTSAIPLQDTFSLMTYNIGYLSGMTNNLPVYRSEELYSSNLKYAAELFSEESPDIITFQEIDYHSSRSYFVNQFDELGKLGSFSEGASVVNWDKTYVPFPYWPIKYHFGEILSGQAVFSNADILSNERLAS